MRRLVSAAFSCLLATVPARGGVRGPLPGFTGASPYLIYYGNWDAAKADFARRNYRLVILHPVSNVTAAHVATIRRGPDNLSGTADDVPVLGYVSIGEDDRPAAPVAGDRLGPRIDPRASDDESLAGLAPLGSPSPSGTAFASYYLDDADKDGLPDRNAIFGAPFVNPGDPAWYPVLRDARLVGDGTSGLREVVSTDFGRALGCDGLFLDTLDTAAPNSFGGTRHEWIAPGMQSLIRRIASDFPEKLLCGNRGLFFFHPGLKTYAWNPRPWLDFLLFESYVTDNNGTGAVSPAFPQHKLVWAPKVRAEAGRPDGFHVLALGYDPVPASVVAQDWLESQGVQGWPLYRTTLSIDTPFSTESAEWTASHPDASPPEWDSTAEGAPRIGLQEAIPGDAQVTLRWDVARDQTGPVRYQLYWTDQPALDFATARKLANVTPLLPENYRAGSGPGRFPYEWTVSGLANGVAHRFAVRAEDALGHEDQNTVVLAFTPFVENSDLRQIAIDGSFADWTGVPVRVSDAADGTAVDFADVAVTNDADFLYLRFTLHAPATPFATFNTHVFIDTDANASTGFALGGLGSELMIESGQGYDQRAGGFNEGGVNGLQWALGPGGSATVFEARLSLHCLHSDGSRVFSGSAIRVLLQDNRGGETTPVVSYTLRQPFATAYAEWAAGHFASPSAASADPDGDGLANGAEFALGTDPTRGDASPLALEFRDFGGVEFPAFSHLRRTALAGQRVEPEWSEDLAQWSADRSHFVLASVESAGPGLERVTWRLTRRSGAPPQWVRLRVTWP